MEHANQNLGTERIGKLKGQYAIPCIISLLVGALENKILRDCKFSMTFCSKN